MSDASGMGRVKLLGYLTAGFFLLKACDLSISSTDDRLRDKKVLLMKRQMTLPSYTIRIASLKTQERTRKKIKPS